MNRKILLNLLAVPATISATLAPLFLATVANATDSIGMEQASCDAPLPLPSNLKTSTLKPHRGILVASSGKISRDELGTDFTEAESDAAVQLFGCDCPACIRSLRQLQHQSLSQKVLSGGSQGHCLAYLQKRVSPQAVKDVLKTLGTDKTQ
jgi:hypothetical protein